MTAIDFSVGGEPVAQPRVKGRIAGKGRKQFIHIYTPGGADEWKAAVAIAGRIAFKGFAPIENPVCLKLSFRMPRPEGHYRTTKALGRVLRMLSALWHTKRPDLDNMEKAVMDALTGIAWVDDCQVCQKYSEKRYAREDEPMGVRIVICQPEADFCEPELPLVEAAQ